MQDIIIVGAGPAGLTAGIYAKRAGKNIKIFEKNSVGGHITSSPLVANYPGLKDVSGMEIASNLESQLNDLGVEVEYEEVLSITDGKIKKVVTDVDEYETKAVIIATGTEYRTLNLPNEDKFIGNGISFCVTCDGAFYKDKVVAVVGGGNAAAVAALELSKICEKVYMIVRSNLKCEKIDISKINNTNNIEVLLSSNVTKLIGIDELKGIEINNKDEINIDGLFYAIGQIPSIPFNLKLEKDESGFIKADSEGLTNIPGIFIAGDLKSKKVRQLTTATSDGTTAALSAVLYVDNY